MQVHACMDKSADRPHDQPSITANKWYQQFKKKKKKRMRTLATSMEVM